MDIYKETTQALADVWDDNSARQKAKIVLLQAFANASDISVKQADDILNELDRLLLKEEEENTKSGPRGL